VLGTLNPSAGDVSVFVPTEQAALAQTTSGPERTHLFALYNVAGNFMGALGALATGLPVVLAHAYGVELSLGDRSGFVLYAAVAVVTAMTYLGLGSTVETRSAVSGRPLARSRRVVVHLAALFSLDSFGGGFVVQSILVLWLYERFHLSVPVVGSIFFAAGILGGLSQLVSPILAARRPARMVFTHLPANLLLVTAGLVSDAQPVGGSCFARRCPRWMCLLARRTMAVSLPINARRRQASPTCREASQPLSLPSSPGRCSCTRPSAGRWSVAGC
jgi:hypothetical protein